jgi:hypothetical protein
MPPPTTAYVVNLDISCTIRSSRRLPFTLWWCPESSATHQQYVGHDFPWWPSDGRVCLSYTRENESAEQSNSESTTCVTVLVLTLSRF